MYKTLRVFAPASVANVCSGFDVLGFAIAALGDELTIEHSSDKKMHLTIVGSHGVSLSCDPTKNASTVPILTMCKELDIAPHFTITLHKNMPIGSGLGSSASSAAAGAFALNEFLNLSLTRKDLISFAMKGEEVACGAAHADNVAASLLGGVVLVNSYNPLNVIEIPTPPSHLTVVVVHPHIELRTADSRRVLPDSYSRSTVISQLGSFGALVVGLVTGDNNVVKAGLYDYLAAPYRATLIPCYHLAQQAALDQGALGFGISGAGPSLFALCTEEARAKATADAIIQKFQNKGISSTSYISPIDKAGCTVLANNSIS
jgi:homoserine kinase